MQQQVSADLQWAHIIVVSWGNSKCNALDTVELGESRHERQALGHAQLIFENDVDLAAGRYLPLYI